MTGDMLAEILDETSPTVVEQGEATLPMRAFALRLRASIPGMKETEVAPLERIYDYSFAEQTIAALDQSGWRPSE